MDAKWWTSEGKEGRKRREPEIEIIKIMYERKWTTTKNTVWMRENEPKMKITKLKKKKKKK